MVVPVGAGCKLQVRRRELGMFSVIVGEVSKILQAWAWPGAVLLLAWCFRTEIKEALPRVKEVGPTGVKMNDAPQQQRVGPVDSPKELSPVELGEPSKAIRLVEEKLNQQILEISADKRLPILLRELAQCRIFLHFERVYRIIFGSQIRALQSLNERPKVSVSEAIRFYDDVVKEFSPFYDDFSFERWSGFLINNSLVEMSEGYYVITDAGREFLHFITEARLPLEKPG